LSRPRRPLQLSEVNGPGRCQAPGESAPRPSRADPTESPAENDPAVCRRAHPRSDETPDAPRPATTDSDDLAEPPEAPARANRTQVAEVVPPHHPPRVSSSGGGQAPRCPKRRYAPHLADLVELLDHPLTRRQGLSRADRQGDRADQQAQKNEHASASRRREPSLAGHRESPLLSEPLCGTRAVPAMHTPVTSAPSRIE
jgi:hypothetical protein